MTAEEHAIALEEALDMPADDGITAIVAMLDKATSAASYWRAAAVERQEHIETLKEQVEYLKAKLNDQL